MVRNNKIIFNDALNIANKCAKKHLFEWHKIKLFPPPYISDNCLEDEGCWMFFFHESIYIPPYAKAAFAISKKGEARIIADFSNDPKMLVKYLKDISDYFINKGL